MTSARQEYFVSSSNSERGVASVKADELEIKLESQLVEMRKAQDALRKAIDARRLLNKVEVTEQNEVSSGDDSGDNDSDDTHMNICNSTYHMHFHISYSLKVF